MLRIPLLAQDVRMRYAYNNANVVMFAAYCQGCGTSYTRNIATKCSPLKKSNGCVVPAKTQYPAHAGTMGNANPDGAFSVFDLVTRCWGLMVMFPG